jgi:hypothetical protein
MMAKFKREYQLLSRLAHLQNEKFAQLQKQYEILAKQHSELERDAFKSFKSASEKYGHNNIEGNNDRNRQSLCEYFNFPKLSVFSFLSFSIFSKNILFKSTFSDLAFNNNFLTEGKQTSSLCRKGGRG